MRTYKTYSYDIFDTCLIRSCGEAVRVFDLLAKRVLKIKEEDNSIWLDFAAERRFGEHRARKKLIRGSKEEVTLDEIYDECHFSSFTTMPKESIKQMEMEIERSVLMPVYDIKAEIDNLHKQGQHVLFVSDMYLPEDFLVSVLKSYGLFLDGDSLFVSSTSLKSKSSGNLFRHIQNQLNIPFKQWIHKGDNRYSDYQIPKKLGIKAELVCHPYTYYEKQLNHKHRSCVSTASSIMAGISRAVRLSNEDSARYKFATDFVAPVYVPFVLWILSDAARRGIRQLFFLARDAYIFYLIAKCYADAYPQIRLKYIYVSRKSLYFPGLPDISAQSILSLFMSVEKVSVYDILERLQLSDYPIKEDMTGLSTREIVEKLFEDQSFVERLKKQHEKQNIYCRQYFEEQGLTEANSAIVDLRGTRRCYATINAILQSMGKEPVYGYYLETIVSGFKGQGGYKTFCYIGYDGIGLPYNIPLLPPEVFEQYFSVSDHERTSHYIERNGHIYPMFDRESKDLQDRKAVFSVNSAICCQYAKLFRELIDTPYYGHLCNEALLAYHRFYKAPAKEYVEALEGITFSTSESLSEPILKKDSILHIILSRKKTRWWWANMIYNITCPDLFTFLLRSVSKLNEWIRST